MFKTISALTMMATLLFAVGCEEEAPAEEKAQADTAKVEPAIPEKTAEEKAAEEKAAAEEKKRAEEAAAAEAELAKNPLRECCAALGKKGFTLRSPEYMAASKACGEGMKEEKDMASTMPGIKEALKDKALPDECAAK